MAINYVKSYNSNEKNMHLEQDYEAGVTTVTPSITLLCHTINHHLRCNSQTLNLKAIDDKIRQINKNPTNRIEPFAHK